MSIQKIHLRSDSCAPACASIRDPLTTVMPFELTCFHCQKFARKKFEAGFEITPDGWVKMFDSIDERMR